jgi:hypothetical protein
MIGDVIDVEVAVALGRWPRRQFAWWPAGLSMFTGVPI